MSPVRKAAAPPAPPPAVEGVDFGDLAFYNQGSFTLPEGDYAFYFDVRNHAFTRANGTQGEPRLGVMVAAYPLTGGDPHEVFYSMGTKAGLSFQPNPDSAVDGLCKSLMAIPGGPAAGLPGSTNWNMLLKSLYDSGLEQGVFGNDLTVLDGLWAHTQNVPEPEERKNFGAKTGDVQEERRAGVISIVSEILEGGKPWEGGGGLPEEGQAPAPAAAPAPRAVARPAPVAARPVAAAPAARLAPRPAPKAAAAPAAEEVDTTQAALEGMGEVLSANEKGCARLLLKTGTFKAVSGKYGNDMAQAVIDEHFKDDASINAILGQHGYVIAGPNVKPNV